MSVAHYERDKTKMITPNLESALYTHSNWYLFPWDGSSPCFNNFYTYPDLNSVIAHKCPKNPKNYPLTHLQWRVSLSVLNLPCTHCGRAVPKPLQALWKLHNWDYLSKPLVTGGLNLASVQEISIYTGP